MVGEQFVMEGPSGENVEASVIDYNHADQMCHVIIDASGEEKEMTYDDVIDFIENSEVSSPA